MFTVLQTICTIILYPKFFLFANPLHKVLVQTLANYGEEQNHKRLVKSIYYI